MAKKKIRKYVDAATNSGASVFDIDVLREAKAVHDVMKRLGVDRGFSFYVELEKNYRARCAEKNRRPRGFYPEGSNLQKHSRR